MDDKASEQATNAAPTSAASEAKAADAPLPVEAPKIASAPVADSPHAAAEKIGPFLPVIFTPAAQTKADDSAPAEKAGDRASSRWHLPRHAPLAAGLALALLLGALAGSAATATFMRDASATGTTEANHALQHSVMQLGTMVASLKAEIAGSQRASSAQFGKLAERLDRTEKAQAEPVAKLAKLQDSIDKLDRRQQQAAAAPDVTGSVVAKQDTRPPVLEGWRLRDFYAGRAVVESRSGALFEVGPGSSLPGLGKVEAIKRDNGRVVVVTASGTIEAALEPRRHSPPYRY